MIEPPIAADQHKDLRMVRFQPVQMMRRSDLAAVAVQLVKSLVVLCVLAMGGAHAREAFVLETPAGALSLREGTESECKAVDLFRCDLLTLNERLLLADFSVRIDGIYPAQDEPKVVLAYTWQGGVSVSPTAYLIDLTIREPVLIPVELDLDGGLGNVTSDASALSFEVVGVEEGPLGEDLRATYRYAYGSSKLEKVRSESVITSGTIRGKTLPTEVLDDPAQRRVLLELMGDEEFRELRERFVSESPLEWKSESLVFGHGLVPSSLGGWAGAFAIDTKSNRAWVAYTKLDSAKFFGTLTDNDSEVRAAFDQWIRRYNYSWHDFNDFEGRPATARVHDADGAPDLELAAPAVRVESEVTPTQATLPPEVPVEAGQRTSADRFIEGAVGGFGLVLLIGAIAFARWLWRTTKDVGEKGVAAGARVFEGARHRLDGVPDAGPQYDGLYATALHEITSGERNSASWAKALANSDGDVERAKSLYIKYRVEQLKRDNSVT